MFCRDYITTVQGREQRVRAFLNYLVSLKSGWFKELITALNTQPKYQHLVELLEPSKLILLIES